MWVKHLEKNCNNFRNVGRLFWLQFRYVSILQFRRQQEGLTRRSLVHARKGLHGTERTTLGDGALFETLFTRGSKYF